MMVQCIDGVYSTNTKEKWQGLRFIWLNQRNQCKQLKNQFLGLLPVQDNNQTSKNTLENLNK